MLTSNLGTILFKIKFSRFKYPCLIIHGNGDIIHNYQDSIRFYNKISSEDKKLRIFQDGLHDIHQDSDSDLLKEIISEWLTSKISASPKKLGKQNKDLLS